MSREATQRPHAFFESLRPLTLQAEFSILGRLRGDSLSGAASGGETERARRCASASGAGWGAAGGA